MISQIITILTNFIVWVIESTGYVGVAVLMGLESACVPLPSEIIMPFAGFVVSEGKMTLFGIALAGAVGSMIGSVATYWLGKKLGRGFLEKYGKYVLVSRQDLDLADRFFAKYGLLATLIGRVTPVVRTFISVPAGVTKVNFGLFTLYSFLGSFVWSYFLGYIGYRLGPEWMTLRERAHWIDYVIITALILGIIWWVRRHLRHRAENKLSTPV